MSMKDHYYAEWTKRINLTNELLGRLQGLAGNSGTQESSATYHLAIQVALLNESFCLAQKERNEVTP